MNEREKAMYYANTLLSQLGGAGRLRAMIGAKDFISLSPDDKRRGGLQFSLPAFGNPKVNKIVIELSYLDLYNVTFYFMRRSKGVMGAKVVAKVDDVFCDDLKSVIEKNTGLYLTMGKVFA